MSGNVPVETTLCELEAIRDRAVVVAQDVLGLLGNAALFKNSEIAHSFANVVCEITETFDAVQTACDKAVDGEPETESSVEVPPESVVVAGVLKSSVLPSAKAVPLSHVVANLTPVPMHVPDSAQQSDVEADTEGFGGYMYASTVLGFARDRGFSTVKVGTIAYFLNNGSPMTKTQLKNLKDFVNNDPHFVHVEDSTFQFIEDPENPETAPIVRYQSQTA